MIYLLSEPALFLVCLLMAAGITLVATLVILLFRPGESRRRPSLLPAPFITAIVLPVSIVLGLLVNDTWKRFMEAQDVVQREAALLQLIDSHQKQMVAPFREPVRAAMERYEQVQIPADWRLFARGQRPSGEDGLRALLDQFDHWLSDEQGVPEVHQLQLERLRGELLELRDLRTKRIILSAGKMDAPKWLVLLCLLFTCTLAMSEITLHMRSAYLTIAALFILGNGSLIYMLTTHERPFAGGASVPPPQVVHQAQAAAAPELPTGRPAAAAAVR